jgi:hypothetical protein
MSRLPSPQRNVADARDTAIAHLSVDQIPPQPNRMPQRPADQIPTSHQHEDCQSARSHCSFHPARPSRRGDRVSGLVMSAVVICVDLVMSTLRLGYPHQETSREPAGTSHLGQERTSHEMRATACPRKPMSRQFPRRALFRHAREPQPSEQPIDVLFPAESHDLAEAGQAHVRMQLQEIGRDASRVVNPSSEGFGCGSSA